MEFNGLLPPVRNPTTLPLNNADGTIISDPFTGERLFSVHASGVYDRNVQPFPRSNELLFASVLAVLPHPGNSTQFYVVNLSGQPPAGDLEYSLVDLTLNNGLGDLSGPSRQPLAQNLIVPEVAAFSSPTGNRHWLVTHAANTNDFLFFECNAQSGLSNTPIIHSIGPVMVPASASPGMRMAVSATNDRLVMTWGPESGSFEYDRVWLFDLDPVNGTIGNPLQVKWDPLLSLNDVEFSSNGQVLYVAAFNSNPVHHLVQFDLGSWDSTAIVGSVYSIEHPFYPDYEAFSLRTGPDGRLYAISNQGGWYLFNIWHLNQPDSLGAACDPDTAGAFMGNTAPAVFTLPWTFWPYLPNVGMEDGSVAVGNSLHFWLNADGIGSATLDRPMPEPLHTTITDEMGRTVLATTWPAGTQQLQFEVSHLSSGVYCIRVGTDRLSGNTLARFVKE